jgi:hypothetical protein
MRGVAKCNAFRERTAAVLLHSASIMHWNPLEGSRDRS